MGGHLGPVSAASNDDRFSTTSHVVYAIDETGSTTVNHLVSLTNLTDTLYVQSYSLTLSNQTVTNIAASTQDGEGLKAVSVFNEEADETVITVYLSQAVVGLDRTQQFNLTYTDTNIAQKTGEVWEITIPKLAQGVNSTSFDIDIITPASFGTPAYISPHPSATQITDETTTYSFTKDQVSATSITAAFGLFQVFSFDLTYHLENPVTQPTDVEIAVPPDTAFQKAVFDEITPPPVSIRVDADGNYLALYQLTNRQRLDVKAKGFVQLYAAPREFRAPSNDYLSKTIASSKYWQTSNEDILALAKKYTTPKAIYDYVRTALTYDYDRVKPNIERLGALEALTNPTSAICMEYTDLFIAIARAAGIPTREVNGYAYTENPKIQPLSLVADVLHAWPEYWDSAQKVWVPVDPTWGSTTGGLDYFTKLDLRHITFVIHGEDPTKPYPPGSYKLGATPQKDVYVSISKLPEVRNSTFSVTFDTLRSAPIADMILVAWVTNSGPSTLYDLPYNIYFDTHLVQSGTINELTPYSKTSVELSVPVSVFGVTTPQTIALEIDGKSYHTPTFKTLVTFTHLTLFLLLVFSVVLFVYLKVIRKIDTKSQTRQ